MTRRFLRACENPMVNIIGHPSARRIGKRPSVEVDWDELYRACAATCTALEVNCHPERLDLPSDRIKAARDAGVKFSIDTDSHATGHLAFLKYGVGTAQRGWLATGDVRSEEHTSELQSRRDLVCRLLLEKKKKTTRQHCSSQRTPKKITQP